MSALLPEPFAVALIPLRSVSVDQGTAAVSSPPTQPPAQHRSVPALPPPPQPHAYPQGSNSPSRAHHAEPNIERHARQRPSVRARLLQEPSDIELRPYAPQRALAARPLASC